MSAAPDPAARWLDALDQRHLALLTPAEVARALRALSSCYVERRDKLASGGALDSAGKRAAFALYYSPLHFFTVREILRALAAADSRVQEVFDIGCGTGVAGAAWALHAGARRVAGFDRNPWAVAEANWTYARLGVDGRASRADAGRLRLGGRRSAIVAAYAINEFPASTRTRLLEQCASAHREGAAVLVVEPIARRGAPWWEEWAGRFAALGGRADDWRFPADLPIRQKALAKAAGLDPRELTARTLYLDVRL